MSTWLSLLNMELDDVNEYMDPPQDIQPGEEVIGQMTEFDKKLYTLAMMLDKDAKQYGLDCAYTKDKTKRDMLEKQSCECSMKSSALFGIMWVGIHEDCDSWGQAVGIRTGWQIVKMQQEDNGVPRIIKRLMGGDIL